MKWPTWDEFGFQTRYSAACEELRRLGRSRSDVQIAVWMECSPNTLRRYRVRHGVTCGSSGLTAEALHELGLPSDRTPSQMVRQWRASGTQEIFRGAVAGRAFEETPWEGPHATVLRDRRGI